jgi:hypothetical protein
VLTILCSLVGKNKAPLFAISFILKSSVPLPSGFINLTTIVAVDALVFESIKDLCFGIEVTATGDEPLIPEIGLKFMYFPFYYLCPPVFR